MSEQWIPWEPKVGDIAPERYQVRLKEVEDDDWTYGYRGGLVVFDTDINVLHYRIPAPVESPEVKESSPPWIDPQCKFRWGDRVKDREGYVWYVNNPQGGEKTPVIITSSLHMLYPYCPWEIAESLTHDYQCTAYAESELTLFPENLPPHYDDRFEDTDQPQEQAPKPMEVWINVYLDGGLGSPRRSYKAAHDAMASMATPTLFRQVMDHNPLTNMQYSPGG